MCTCVYIYIHTYVCDMRIYVCALMAGLMAGDLLSEAYSTSKNIYIRTRMCIYVVEYTHIHTDEDPVVGN